LTFPVVLQRQWEISRLYGMFSTPIGYLIDAQGVIAADVAVGTEPILALLSGPVVRTDAQAEAPSFWEGGGAHAAMKRNAEGSPYARA
jgi:hypothetical protein